MTRGRPRERGALLLDAMIAVSFFAIALATWAAMTTQKLKTIGEADRRFRATAAAQSAIAEAREGTRKPGPFAVAGPGGLAGDLQLQPRSDGLQEIVVVVRWREPGSAAREEEKVVVSTAGKP